MTLNQCRSWMFCTLFAYAAVLKLYNGQANTCDNNLPDIANAKPGGNNTPPFTVNTRIRYFCNPGFQSAQGNVFAECVLENNSPTWVLSENRCTHKSCSHPGTIENGRKIGDDFRFGKNVTYKCNTGYQIVGRATIFCGAKGDWSDSLPSCTIISCDMPPKPANGSVRYNSLTYRSKAIYTCDNSFRFVGIDDDSVTRECLANKTWSGSVPQCEEVQCPDLPRGPGITITDVSSDKTNHVGKRVYFKCDNEQPAVTTCMPSGKWSITPDCGEEIFCPVPPLPPGIIIVHLLSQGQEKYKVNDVISYLCQSSGNRTFAKCNSDGTWSTLPGHCEEVTIASPTTAPLPKSSTEANGIKTPCGKAPQIQHGTVTYLESQNAQYECNSGFTLKGSAVLKCLSSERWDSTPPSCEKKFPVGLVIGIVVGALVVIAGGIAAGILFYKKKKSATPSKKKASPSDAVTMEEIQKLEKNSKPVPVTVL